MTDFESRFWAKVAVSDGCWLWTGATNERGYGHIVRAGRFVQAHRAAYELAGGEIPEGLVLDHLCREPRCVRPSHLEPVTHRENLARGRRGGWAHRRTEIGDPAWRTALTAQGRTLRWLALQTGKSPRTVYAYSRGDLVPPREWIVAANRAMGIEEAA